MRCTLPLPIRGPCFSSQRISYFINSDGPCARARARVPGTRIQTFIFHLLWGCSRVLLRSAPRGNTDRARRAVRTSTHPACTPAPSHRQTWNVNRIRRVNVGGINDRKTRRRNFIVGAEVRGLTSDDVDECSFARVSLSCREIRRKRRGAAQSANHALKLGIGRTRDEAGERARVLSLSLSLSARCSRLLTQLSKSFATCETRNPRPSRAAIARCRSVDITLPSVVIRYTTHGTATSIARRSLILTRTRVRTAPVRSPQPDTGQCLRTRMPDLVANPQSAFRFRGIYGGHSLL